MEDAEHFLTRVNWQRPWLAPLLPTARLIIKAEDWRQAINMAATEMAVRNHRGLPISFVPQEDLPLGVGYEAYISATGCVPTRNNLHDFFNALIWLNYPQVKMQLNALQAAEIAAASESNNNCSQRGKVRDAATIFDENAAMLITHDQNLIGSLRNHEWQDVFITRRHIFEDTCEVRLFGHALIEKLVSPYKAITAHTWIASVNPSFFMLDETQKKMKVDLLVTNQLAAGIKTEDFTPLPVLGVPGWWTEQDHAFYADSTVFRPRRRPRIRL